MGSLPLATGNLLCFSLVTGLEPRYRHNMLVATCLPEDLAEESKAFPIIRETKSHVGNWHRHDSLILRKGHLGLKRSLAFNIVPVYQGCWEKIIYTSAMLGFQLFYLVVEQGVFEFPARNLSIWPRNLTLTRFCLTEPEFDVSRSFLFG